MLLGIVACLSIKCGVLNLDLGDAPNSYGTVPVDRTIQLIHRLDTLPVQVFILVPLPQMQRIRLRLPLLRMQLMLMTMWV